jgi:hypothetical protein
LKSRLDLKNREVQQYLDSLPPSFSDNPQAMLLSICGEFTTEMAKYIYGDAGYASFFQDIHAEFGKLAQEIRCTKPRFDIPKSAERTNSVVEPKPVLPTFTFRVPSVVAGCSDPESTDGNKRAR